MTGNLLSGKECSLVTSRLIRIYTVSNPFIDLCLKPLFATMDLSKFRDGSVHFRNSGMKALTK